MRILLLLLLPIGDTLFTTPAIHALRKKHPDAHITALVYPTNAGILRSNPDIDEFLYWPTRQTWPGLRGVLWLFWTLRQVAIRPGGGILQLHHVGYCAERHSAAGRD